MSGKAIHQRYIIRETICTDTASEDYKAWDEQELSFVTLTLYRDDVSKQPAFIDALSKLSSQVLALDHPAIRKYKAFNVKDPIYTVADFVPGITLQKALEQNSGNFYSPRNLNAIRQICVAVDYLHRNNVIHGNITTNDILVTQAGELILGRFTPLSYFDAPSPLFFRFVSPIYAAPEVLAGAIPTKASDIYSLAVIIYQILTQNNLPYDGRRSNATGGSFERLREEKETLPPYEMGLFSPSVNLQVETILQRALNPDPAQRYGSAIELFSELKESIENSDRIDIPASEGKSVSIPSGLYPKDASPKQKTRSKISIPQRKVKTYSLLSKLFLILSIVFLIFSLVGLGFYDSWGDLSRWRSNGNASTPLTTQSMLPIATDAPYVLQPIEQATPSPENSEILRLIAFQGVVTYSMDGRTIELSDALQELSLQSTIRIEIADGIGAIRYKDQMVLGIYPDSVVEIIDRSTEGSTIPFTIVIERGKFLVNAKDLLIQTSDATYQAYTSNGLMGVIYLPSENRFFVHCFGSNQCDLFSVSVGVKRIQDQEAAAFEQGAFLPSLTDSNENWTPLLTSDFMKLSTQFEMTPTHLPSPIKTTVFPSPTPSYRTPTLTPTRGQQAEDRGNEQMDQDNDRGSQDSGGGGDGGGGGMPSD